MKNDLSNLECYKKFAEELSAYKFNDYESLWEWSVNHSDLFWGSLISYFHILVHHPANQVKLGEKMYETNWFPQMNLSYSEHIFRHFENGKTALYYRSESEDLKSITWNEMQQETAAIQSFLKQEGCTSDDCISGVLSNQPEASFAFFASNSIGSIWSSCSPEFGKLAIEERFIIIQPKLLFAVTDYQYGGKKQNKISVIREIRRNIPSIKKIIWVTTNEITLEEGEITWKDILRIHSGALLNFIPLDFNHPLYILFSSGTTGKPKAIVHRQGGILLEHYKYLALHNEVKKGEKYFWYTSTGWMMWNFLQSTFLLGAIPVLYNGSPNFPDLNTLWQLTQATETSHFGTSPSYLNLLSQGEIYPGYTFDLPFLKTISSTGSPLSIENYEYIERAFPNEIRLISMSGGTDVCTAFVGGCSMKPIIKGKIQARCLGAAIYSLSETGEKRINEEGELVITQPMPSMPIGFWNDDEKVKYRESYFNRFEDIWSHGDWVTITDDGYVAISGRSDATLNKFGIRIGTSEIYRSLQNISEVSDGLIIHVNLDYQASILILFVVLKQYPSLDNFVTRKIKQTLKTDYSPRHVPDEIYALQEIPYTLSGKKIELPVKKLFEAGSISEIISKESLRNPWAWEEIVSFHEKWKIKRETTK